MEQNLLELATSSTKVIKFTSHALASRTKRMTRIRKPSILEINSVWACGGERTERVHRKVK